MEKVSRLGRFLKVHIINEYASILKGVSAIVISNVDGVTNKDMESLRKKLRPVTAQCVTVKNSLCMLAFKEIKIDGIARMVNGSCAVSSSRGDLISMIKILVDFAKVNSNFKLKGGYVDGGLVSPERLKELAALPSKEALIARLVSCINAPIAGLVTSCNGIITKFMYALSEISKKKSE